MRLSKRKTFSFAGNLLSTWSVRQNRVARVTLPAGPWFYCLGSLRGESLDHQAGDLPRVASLGLSFALAMEIEAAWQADAVSLSPGETDGEIYDFVVPSTRQPASSLRRSGHAGLSWPVPTF